MSRFSFEGDVNSFNASQIQFLSSVLEDHGFKDGKVLIDVVGKADDNYVANVKRITIEEDGKIFKMIAKVAPTSEVLRANMSTPYLFKNEHAIYMQVFPKFSELEKEADVPQVDRLRYAKCYGTFMEEPNEIILLEDLKESNYTILDKYVSLTNETVKMVITDFAKLHSLSYALKNRYPDTYDTLKNQLYSTWILTENLQAEMFAFFNQLESSVLAILNNEKHKKLVKGSVVNLPKSIVRNLKRYDTFSKYSVIQQGDSWTNNIMFKVEDDQPIECCMIDYQISCHNSPAADLHYMIFNCTDYATRSKHYNDWIDFYHSQLEKFLSNYGLKVNFIYPRDQLDADLKRLSKTFFGTSVMLASMLMRESDEASKIKDAMQQNGFDEMIGTMANISVMGDTSKKRFIDRVEGLIDSFVELGYL